MGYAERLADFTKAGMQRAEALNNEIRLHHMAPRGEMGLPETLERARWEYLIPDEMFSIQPAFSTVLVAPLPPKGQAEKFCEGGLIEMPDTMSDAVRNETPRGVLIGAGLRAIDILKSNAILLGDVVFFVRHSPPVVRVGAVKGTDQYLYSLHVAEIRGSWEAMDRQRKGEMKIVEQQYTDATGTHREHVYEMNGEKVSPELPEEPQTLFE